MIRSMTEVTLQSIQSAVNTSLALLVVILILLVVSIIFRFIVFAFQKKATAQQCQGCDCEKGPRHVPPVSKRSHKRSTKLENSSKRSKKSSRVEKKISQGKKKTTSSREVKKMPPSGDVDLEKGDASIQTKKQIPRTISNSVDKEQRTTSWEETNVPVETALISTPAPGPLLAEQIALEEPVLPVAAAVDSLIVASARHTMPMEEVAPTSHLHASRESVMAPLPPMPPPTATAAPSLSVASTFGGPKKSTDV